MTAMAALRLHLRCEPSAGSGAAELAEAQRSPPTAVARSSHTSEANQHRVGWDVFQVTEDLKSRCADVCGRVERTDHYRLADVFH